MQTRTMRRLLILALAATLAMGTSATAFANGGGGTAASSQIHADGGSVTETDDGSFSFGPVDLTATDTTSPMEFALTVDDSRGTGTGWTLSMSMTQFTCSTSSTCHTATLPTESILNVTAACVTDVPCTLPNASGTCGVATDSPIADVTSSFDICDATSGGTGSVVVTPTLNIPILSDSYIGTYTSTVTIAIVGN